MIVLLFSVTANTTRQLPNQTAASCRLETTLRARWQGSSWSWKVWSPNTSRTTSGPKDTMYGISAFLKRLRVATIGAILFLFPYTTQSEFLSKSVTYSFNSIRKWDIYTFEEMNKIILKSAQDFCVYVTRVPTAYILKIVHTNSISVSFLVWKWI